MFIGEAPGEEEDLTGEPFVGPSGQVLNKIFNLCGIKREEVFISNIVRCRPPQNRTPLKEEIEKCMVYLEKEIKEVSPKCIITLGAVAFHSLLKRTGTLKDNLLRKFKYKDIIVIPAVHPADGLKKKQDNPFWTIYAAIRIAQNSINKVKKYSYVESEIISDSAKLLKELKSARKIVIDYECVKDKTGLGIFNPYQKKHYFYIGDMSKIKPLLEDNEIEKIVYYAPAETKFLKDYALIGLIDVYPAIYLLAENLPQYNLKLASSVLTGTFNYSINFEKLKDISVERLAKYNKKDCINTWNLYKLAIKMPEELQKLYWHHSYPMTSLLAKLQDAGIFIDINALNNAEETLKKEVDSIEKFIKDYVNDQNFNPRSSAQIAAYLKSTGNDTRFLTPKGQISTSKQALAKLNTPFAQQILEFRKKDKLLDFIKRLRKFIGPDGRIHAYYTFGTETGRTASRDPNMQNIPPDLRYIFSVPPQYKFIKLDFSQIELRVLALVANDTKFIEAFEDDNVDIHSYVASLAFNKKNVTSKMRTSAKKIVFGLIYGMGVNRLANELNIKPEKAQVLRTKILKLFPGLQTFITKTEIQVRRDSQVSNLFGRKRRFNFIHSKRSLQTAIREAVNFKIQSTASDIVQLFFLQLDEKLVEKKLDAKLINFVHDEADFEVNEKELKKFKQAIRETCAEFKQYLKKTFNVDLKVKIRIDGTIGNNWKELNPMENFVIS